MSQLLDFTNFIKHRDIAAEDLEKFQELIEPMQHEGWHGYRLKPLGPTDRVTQRCQTLIQYTWHCRDHVKKILSEHGVPGDVGKIVNGYIEISPDIQVISYLANSYKHGGIDRTPKWAGDVEPRIAKPFVRGMLHDFPSNLKPTVILAGDKIGEFEFVGHASVDGEDFQFKGFDWEFDCSIVDKNGKALGNAAAMCESAFQTWIKILNDHGISLTQV